MSASGAMWLSEGLSILYFSLEILHKECLPIAARGAASEHVLRFWARESGVVNVVASRVWLVYLPFLCRFPQKVFLDIWMYYA